MQDGIKVEDGKISKINKHAGWNKAVYYGVPNWHTDPNKHTGTKILSRLINAQTQIRAQVCKSVLN